MAAPVMSNDGNPARATTPVAQRWLPAALIVVSIVLTYWNSLQSPFLFDDTGAILNNSTIRRLWSWDVLHPPNDGSTTTARPLVNVSFAINYAISGERVWSYHAFNLVIHTLTALVLMGLARRTLDARAGFSRSPLRLEHSDSGPQGLPSGDATIIACFTALLWALHPLQTETVVGIAQRTESLCALLYLLTLYAFARGIDSHPVGDNRQRQQRAGWFVVSVASCLLGMAAKEVMVTAPLVVLLYDRTFVAKTFSAAWRARRGYYVALATTWLALATLLVHSGGARGIAAGFGLGVSWWSYLLKQCDALVTYLKLTVWPHPLTLDYGTAVVSSPVEVWWQGLVVLALLAATVWALVRKPIVGFAGAWFFLILAPSSSFVPLVTQTIAEHRMYLPLASLTGLLAFTVQRHCGAWSPWLCAIAALTLGGATIARNHDYQNPVAIWTANVATHPDVARGHNNLAWTLQKQGRSDEANAHFARAIALQPGYLTAHYSWGVALLDQGRATEAIAQFETAVQLAPNHADAHLNLGNALMQVRRAADAIPHYEAALRLRPAADAHYNLGVALVDVGRTDEGASHFRAALKETPALPEAHYQLARIAERAGQLADAERDYNETLRLAPDHAAAHAKLGLLLARSDRLSAAAEHLRSAVRLAPADADAHANLGNVLLLQGQPREAIVEYETALRLRPNDPRTIESLQLARESLR